MSQSLAMAAHTSQLKVASVVVFYMAAALVVRQVIRYAIVELSHLHLTDGLRE